MLNKKENNTEKSTEEYEPSWNEEGKFVLKKKSKVNKGKISRARGARFELKVRNDLEKKGWIVDKWTNNMDLEVGKLVKAKRKYNPFKKMLIIGTGFPDFVAFKRINDKYHEVMGVEVKTNGVLAKTEKEKCAKYLEQRIFSKILIATGIKKGRKLNIEYIDFKDRYPKFLSKDL